MLTLALGASGAYAAEGFGCRASAARLTSSGIVDVEPAVADSADVPCATQSMSVATVPSPLSSLLSVQTLTAQTAASTGSANSQAGVLAPTFLGVLGGIEASSLTAHAAVQCSDGQLVSSSGSQVVDLTVDGTAYGTVAEARSFNLPGVGTLYVNRTVSEGSSVTQRALEVSLLPSLSGGLAGADLVLGEASASAPADSCAASPGHIPIPGPLHPVHSGPPQPQSEADAPANELGGELVPGSFAGRQAAAALALQCNRGGLVLIDVLIRHHRVALVGAADKSLIGSTVAISLVSAHKRVATAVVGPDGLFETSAPLPPRRIRYTNKALYQASVGGLRSAALKLVRRMYVTSISTVGGRVLIKGRVITPLARPLARIVVERRMSCHSTIVVARFKPHASGTFTVSLPAPSQTAAIYQARTLVRGVKTSRATYPTSTLPRVVAVK